MDNSLFSVVTITEAAELWGLHENTIRRAIDAKYKPIQARRSGRVILLSYASCVSRWGKPRRVILTRVSLI